MACPWVAPDTSPMSMRSPAPRSAANVSAPVVAAPARAVSSAPSTADRLPVFVVRDVVHDHTGGDGAGNDCSDDAGGRPLPARGRAADAVDRVHARRGECARAAVAVAHGRAAIL